MAYLPVRYCEILRFTQDDNFKSLLKLQNIMNIVDEIKYDANGLVPVIVQDYKNNEVLMVAYMNGASLKTTLETGITHFWSRSRQKFWKKGESSGAYSGS